MSRSDSRRDYRHFPREYTDLLVAFERDGRAVLSFDERREASTARRQLYQFKMLAIASSDADPEDAQARWLVNVFNTCTLRIEHAHDDTYDRWLLVLDSNPIVRAMRARPLDAPPQTEYPLPQVVVTGATSEAVPPQSPQRGCHYPAACRSAFHGSPAFCECGEAASA